MLEVAQLIYRKTTIHWNACISDDYSTIGTQVASLSSITSNI